MSPGAARRNHFFCFDIDLIVNAPPRFCRSDCLWSIAGKMRTDVSFGQKSIISWLLLLTFVSQTTEAQVVAGVRRDPINSVRSNIKTPPASSAYQQEQGMTPTQLILRWKPLVAKASYRAGVAVAWINAVMRVESGGCTMLAEKEPIISSRGALGLMQVLPQTYQEVYIPTFLNYLACTLQRGFSFLHYALASRAS